ncbi:MAG: uroporphyrinogen-III C-methyltransferase [bacterium]|jgi:uroporphyrin-III C-methyltransferase
MIWDNEHITHQGSVVLAGAGPGDPDLITIKLQKCLGLADVIIADRLVNPLILDLHASKEAQIVLAGKQGYNNASLSQDEVTDLILSFARAGKKVLRLKGGDVAFFSNVLDELEMLVQAHIPFEIIPGITSASGASAYAGIPLTARGYAQGVQFLSFNPNANYSELFWRSLAQFEDTSVLYMASKNLALFIDQMLRHGAIGSMPIAVIEQATTEHQHVHLSTLADAEQRLLNIEFSSPSLVIVGHVVTLHNQFNWFKGMKKGSVFPNLS